jgi:hypothetical protein
MVPNEFLQIGRTIDAGQASIEDELGDPHCGLDLDLQDVRRELHAADVDR